MYIKNTNGKIVAHSDEIGKIVIYGHGEKLITIDSGVIKIYTTHKNRYGSKELTENRFMSGSIESITLANPIVNARKENLTRKDNYFLSYAPDYLPWERRKALYIHESEIVVNDLGNMLAMETEEEKNYLHAAKIEFVYPVTICNYHQEKIPTSGNWTLPDGAKWGSGYGTKDNPQFDTYDNSKSLFAQKHPERANPAEKGVIKRYTTNTVVDFGFTCIVTERYYTITEYSEDRKRKNAIAAALNNSGLFNGKEFSHYDIDKLEKVLGKLSAPGMQEA